MQNRKGLKYAITVGRRQPMHKGHLDCIKEIKQHNLIPVIIIGSANLPNNKFYNPYKNPLNTQQQITQIKIALKKLNIEQYKILTLADKGDINLWSLALNNLLNDNDIEPQSAIFHYRPKIVSNLTSDEKIKDLDAYTDIISKHGIAIWKSANQDKSLDHLNSTFFRTIDLKGKEFIEQKINLVAPDYIIQLAEEARKSNPEISHLPLTMCDIALLRLKQERNLTQKDIFKNLMPQSIEELAKLGIWKQTT